MSNKLKTKWDNNMSLGFIRIRYTDVLGRFLARYLSMPADIEGFFKYGIGLDGETSIWSNPRQFVMSSWCTKKDRYYVSASYFTHVLLEEIL